MIRLQTCEALIGEIYLWVEIPPGNPLYSSRETRFPVVHTFVFEPKVEEYEWMQVAFRFDVFCK